jgi:hypothetical protein
MTMQFAMLFRSAPDAKAKASPADMQAEWKQWKDWMTKYANEILAQSPPRSGPKPGGKVAVCRGGALTDGPFVEGKEIVGGWTFIQTETFEQAAEIAKEVPSFSSVEIIELASF